jgi:hypothetical protein
MSFIDYSRFLSYEPRAIKIGTMPTLPINIRRVAVLIGILLLVFVVLEFNRRLAELNTLNGQKEVMLIQATQAVQTQIALQTQVAYTGSTNAVEEWARTDGHYIQDGDLPVVPLGQPGAPPMEASTPTPVPTQMANWQVWWNLFFGE